MTVHSGVQICLTMIVKDEAHIVCETLAAILPYISDYVIVDTGSQDGTQRVIDEFFHARGLSGQVFERRWRDFGSNRSEALQLAREHSASDYLWMMDADDILVGEPDLSSLTCSAYNVRFGPDFEYWRPQIFKRSASWRYVGVLHEYPACDAPDIDVGHIQGEYHIASRRLGGRNRLPNKYARDAEILEAALRREPQNERYVFYLAQSYFDAGDFERALEQYERRTALAGWDQEVFYSRFRIAQCRERLDWSFDDVQAAYLECSRHHPARAEPLVEAARRARVAGDFASAYAYARQAAGVPRPGPEALFVHTAAYEYCGVDEQAIAAYYLGHYGESFRLNHELLENRALPEEARHRIERNRDFSVPHTKHETLHYNARLVAHIRERAPAATPRVTLSITTCRRLDLFVKTMSSFLNTCMDIHLIDRWICVDDNSGAADRADMQRLFPFFEFVWKGPQDKGHARSMNIIRERVRTPFLLHLEDDWHFFARRQYIEPAIEILQECPDVGQLLFNRNYAETLEDRGLPGGHPCFSWEHGHRFRIHEHYDSQSEEYRRFHAAHPGQLSNVYWPHYSLRPSVLKTAVLERVGAYDEHADHFELAYARRYAATGLRSAFFDGIYCLHIGRLASERASATKANAYALNDMDQFESQRRIRIKPLSRSWPSSEELCRVWSKMSKGNLRWNQIELTHDDDVDFYAVINAPPEGAHFVPERTIVFQMEPRTGMDALPAVWRSPDPSRFYHVRHHADFPNVSEWHLSKTYAQLSAERIEKTKVFSTVTSARYADPGQRKRVDFIHHLEARGFPIEVYGSTNDQGFKSYRGALPPYEKDAGLFPYAYTFAAENHSEHNYFTEKLIDAILAECLCFYWGCPNVSEYIDPGAYIALDLDDFEAAALTIEAAIANHEWEKRIDIIRREKRKILDVYQVFPTLERIVSGMQAGSPAQVAFPDTVVINLDRRPDRLERFRRQAAQCGLNHYRRVAAVDGQSIVMTDEIRHLFRSNDHGYRRGIVGCALSHLQIWQNLRHPTLILEDDVELRDAFVQNLHALLQQAARIDPQWDLILLGYTRWSAEVGEAQNGPSQHLQPAAWNEYMGGLFAYVVSPQGAAKLLARAGANGLQNAVDWFVMKQADILRAYKAVPDLASSPCAQRPETTDTDIQYDQSRLD